MQLIMFKNMNSNIPYQNELTMMRMGLIFSDCMKVISFNFNSLQMIKDFDKISERRLLNAYYFFYKDAANAVTEKMLESNYSSLKKLRNKRGKTKAEIFSEQRLDKWIKSVIGEVKKHIDNYMIFSGEEVFLGFLEDDSLKLVNYLMDDESFQAKMVDYLIESFVNNDVIHFFDESAMRSIEDLTDDDEIDMDEEVYFTTGNLLSVPDFKDFSYNQLRIIRNEFQELFKPLKEEIDNWTKEMENNEYLMDDVIRNDGTVFGRLDAFDELLKNSSEQNIYFQSIKNSNPSNQFRNLNYGITSIKNIINNYKRIRLITKEEESYICEQVSFRKNINNTGFFLYHDLTIKPDENKD